GKIGFRNAGRGDGTRRRARQILSRNRIARARWTGRDKSSGAKDRGRGVKAARLLLTSHCARPEELWLRTAGAARICVVAAEGARNQGVLSGGFVDRLAGGAAAGAADTVGEIEPGFGNDE